MDRILLRVQSSSAPWVLPYESFLGAPSSFGLVGCRIAIIAVGTFDELEA